MKGNKLHFKSHVCECCFASRGRHLIPSRILASDVVVVSDNALSHLIAILYLFLVFHQIVLRAESVVSPETTRENVILGVQIILNFGRALSFTS